ncbi:hypothetical protein ACFY36_13785 [Actinoplanes sp. NPDC000266]
MKRILLLAAGIGVADRGDAPTLQAAPGRATGTARAFWSRAEMVPIDEAVWFTGLLARGRG